jgi:hypothetical protein
MRSPAKAGRIAPRPGRAWDDGSQLRKRQAHPLGVGRASALLGPLVRIVARTVAFGGVLDIPLRHAPEFLPWARRFAAAARHRTENTRQLAPLVKPALSLMARWLAEIGRPELLRTNGHFQVWFGPRSDKAGGRAGARQERLGIPTQAAPNTPIDKEPRAWDQSPPRECARRSPVV